MMKRIQKNAGIYQLICILIMLFPSFVIADITINPVEYTDALRNPLKGLRWGFKNQEWGADFPNEDHPYVTCAKWYIGWEYLENDESDGVSKIRQYSDNIWNDLPGGNHEVEYNAENLSSGIYFSRIEAGQFHDVKKMILLK